jgi:hypothetical protein
MLTLFFIILANRNPGVVMRLTESNPQRKILLDWLNKRDPGLFKRCKIFFDENILLRDVPMRQEGDHSIITAILCGGETKFWINNKTKRVDCYISYCGKNIGHKYCGSEISGKLCEQ